MYGALHHPLKERLPDLPPDPAPVLPRPEDDLSVGYHRGALAPRHHHLRPDELQPLPGDPLADTKHEREKLPPFLGLEKERRGEAAQQEHLEVGDALVVVVVEQRQRVAEREEAAEDRPGAGAGGERQGDEVGQRLRDEGLASRRVGAPGELEAGGGEGRDRRVGVGEEREAGVEQRERADEVVPSWRVGGVCDEQVEEDGGGARRRGWRRGRVGSGAGVGVGGGSEG